MLENVQIYVGNSQFLENKFLNQTKATCLGQH